MTLSSVVNDTLIAAHKEVIGHCVADKPKEAVGFIWADSMVTQMVNRAPDPQRHVLTTPDDMLEAMDRPNDDVAVLSIYHSHPNGTVLPSPSDVANMLIWEEGGWDIAWTIVALKQAEALMSTWRMTDGSLALIHRFYHEYPLRHAY